MLIDILISLFRYVLNFVHLVLCFFRFYILRFCILCILYFAFSLFVIENS